MPQRRVTVTLPPVTEDEAVELTLHHLGLAAVYFEATPDDENAQALEELERQHAAAGDREAPSYRAGQAWLERMLASFDEMKRDDEELSTPRERRQPSHLETSVGRLGFFGDKLVSLGGQPVSSARLDTLISVIEELASRLQTQGDRDPGAGA